MPEVGLMRKSDEATERRSDEGKSPASRRRLWVAVAASCGLLATLYACGPQSPVENPADRKMLVLGMDGLDPKLLKQWMDAGLLPNFKKLAETGTFMPLGTSMPPQSPVAWSNFISGAYPDTHQIWDFIHRQPNPGPNYPLPVRPYLSTSDQAPIAKSWLQNWLPETVGWFGAELPLGAAGERTLNLRRGPAFWESLVPAGVDTVIYRLPAIYPPPPAPRGAHFACLCGMGTPDLMGGYGEFTCFSSEIDKDTSVAGGRFVRLIVSEGRASASLEAMTNQYFKPQANQPNVKFAAELQFVVDAENQSLRVLGGDGAATVLKAGQWSEWTRVTLKSHVPYMGFMTDIKTIVKFYAVSISPVLKVYCSPMQLDPEYPLNAVSTPPEFAADLAKATGPFYTQGIPEDTKALREEPQALNEDQFLSMVEQLAAERTVQYHAALKNFTGGFLFFYFGHTDQLAHVFWRDMDPGHPGRVPEQEGKYEHVLRDVYCEMDVRLGEALARLDDNDALIVMSDHGFSGFRRGFAANTWLRQAGFQVWKGDKASDRRRELLNIDFSQTQAYAVGINSLFVNLKGRERDGIVDPARYDAVLQEVGDKLLAFRDDNGQAVVDRVYYVRKEWPGAAGSEIAPDMLIGYAANYRGSWSTATGGMSRNVLDDNKDRWSGDHCIAHHIVPGSLLTNLKVTADDPTLIDLAPSILAWWGAPRPDGMVGRAVLGGSDGATERRSDEGEDLAGSPEVTRREGT